MTCSAKRASTPGSATVVESAVMDGRSGVHLLVQAERGTQKMVGSLLRHIQAWRGYEIAVRELSKFSDQELADLGITRLDIRSVAWESPGTALKRTIFEEKDDA